MPEGKTLLTIKTEVRESSVDFPELVMQKTYIPRTQWGKKVPPSERKTEPLPRLPCVPEQFHDWPCPHTPSLAVNPMMVGEWRT